MVGDGVHHSCSQSDGRVHIHGMPPWRTVMAVGLAPLMHGNGHEVALGALVCSNGSMASQVSALHVSWF